MFWLNLPQVTTFAAQLKFRTAYTFLITGSWWNWGTGGNGTELWWPRRKVLLRSSELEFPPRFDLESLDHEDLAAERRKVQGGMKRNNGMASLSKATEWKESRRHCSYGPCATWMVLNIRMKYCLNSWPRWWRNTSLVGMAVWLMT